MAVINPDLLRQIPLFELLDNDELTALAAQLDQKHYLKGQMIFSEGDAGGMMYVVQSGKVEVFIKDMGGDIVPLDDALRALSAIDARKGQIVELRFFGGLSVDEIAEVLGVSSRTVLREWDFAKAWLACEISGNKTP